MVGSAAEECSADLYSARANPGPPPGARSPAVGAGRPARPTRRADTRIGVRLPSRRGLQAGDLRPVRRILQEAGGRQQVRQARRGRQDDAGAPDVLRARVVAGQPGEDRSVPRDRAPARASAGADRRRGTPARARRQGLRPHRRRIALDGSRRSGARPAAALRPGERRQRPRYQSDARQRRRPAVADDQSRRPPDGRRVVHAERRHAIRALGPAAAVSGVRRPRQQPRRLHAEHGRVARARAHLAAMGAADHLRAPSDRPVPDAHLAAAVLGAGRHRRAVPDVARSEHDRHGDRQGPRRARPGRRHAHGDGVRRVVSGLRRLRAELQEHRGVLDRDGALPIRHAARIHDRRLPAGHARPPAAEPLLEPLAAGEVASARRRRLHGNRVARR